MSQYLKLFAIAYIGLAIVVAIVLYALEAFANISLGNGVSIAVLLGATMFAGQKYANNEEQLPPKPFSWKFALMTFFVSLFLSLVFAIGLEIFGRQIAGQSPFAEMFDVVPVGFMAFGLLFIAVIHILVVRFFFPFAVKTQLKALKKL